MHMPLPVGLHRRVLETRDPLMIVSLNGGLAGAAAFCATVWLA